MNTIEGRRRKLKSAEELGRNLMLYFGRLTDQTEDTPDTLQLFRDMLSRNSETKHGEGGCMSAAMDVYFMRFSYNYEIVL